MTESKNILPLPAILQGHLDKKLLPLLSQWAQQKKIPQSLLITGAHGCGKTSAAFYLAQTFMCLNNAFSISTEEAPSLFTSDNHLSEKNKEIRPCGQCKSCLRILKNQGIDLEIIQPEKQDETKTGSIKVEQLKNLKTSLGHSAMESTYRVILIQNAEAMTTQAANSLLKVLEEPPSGWIFILTTTEPSLLLPTIVSRCQNLKLSPLTPEVLTALIQDLNLPDTQKKLAIKLSHGNLKKITQMSELEFFENRKKITDFLYDPEKYFLPLIDWSSKDAQNLLLLLDQLDLFCSDLMNINDELFNEDLRPLLLSLRKNNNHNPEIFFTLFEHQQEARAQLHLPLNKKLFTQNLLTPWLNILGQEIQIQKGSPTI